MVTDMSDTKYDHAGRKPGDTVWAFAYTGENRTRGKTLRQTPMKGRLLNSRWPGGDIDPAKPVQYFVPYGKTGHPSWSKTVAAESRRYADTEADAVAGYNAEVMALVEENLAAARRAEADLIPVNGDETE